MSVTVSDLLKLPSLRQARVIAGHGGLKRLVASISVLESVDPDVLVSEIFPSNKYAGGEIVITGFLNCLHNVDTQCSNLQRLIEGGEVGLVLYYVGVYLSEVDRRLIDMANAHDFVLICMPEGERNLRYSDLISDVTECIYRDRSSSRSLVSDILARISSVPHHRQTLSTAIQMLSAQLSCTALLCTSEGKILNLSTWPIGMEETIRSQIESYLPLSPSQEGVPCSFLSDTTLFCLPIQSDTEQMFQLVLLCAGTIPDARCIEQAADTVRICINIWGRQHATVAIHELLRAILQDEPLKMRRLADIFHVDVASLHEIWMLFGVSADAARQRMDRDLLLAKQCADTVIGATFEEHPVMSLSTPHSLRETQAVMRELLSHAQSENPDAVIVRCGGLQNTTACRKAYLLTLENLENVKRIFPHKRLFELGDLEFSADCQRRISEGEAAAVRKTLPLSVLKSDREYRELLRTACVYLLDCECGVTRTAEMLYLHKNTVKYRLQRIDDLLGHRIGKMPEMIELFRSAAIYRLLHDDNE